MEDAPMPHIPLRQTLPPDCDSGTSVPSVSGHSKTLSASRWATFLFLSSSIIYAVSWWRDELICDICVLVCYSFLGGIHPDFNKNLMGRKRQSRWDAKQKKITERNCWEKSKPSWRGRERRQWRIRSSKPSFCPTARRDDQSSYDQHQHRETLITAGFKTWHTNHCVSTKVPP